MGVTRKQNTLIVDEIGTLRRRGSAKKNVSQTAQNAECESKLLW